MNGAKHVALAAALLALGSPAHAEADMAAGARRAVARVDFAIIVPPVLRLNYRLDDMQPMAAGGLAEHLARRCRTASRAAAYRGVSCTVAHPPNDERQFGWAVNSLAGGLGRTPVRRQIFTAALP